MLNGIYTRRSGQHSVVILLRCSYKLLNTFKEDPLMIVSVDHGNKSVKTPNFLFTSGVIVSEDKPPLFHSG